MAQYFSLWLVGSIAFRLMAESVVMTGASDRRSCLFGAVGKTVVGGSEGHGLPFD